MFSLHTCYYYKSAFLLETVYVHIKASDEIFLGGDPITFFIYNHTTEYSFYVFCLSFLL